jgi:hypothetical protein
MMQPAAPVELPPVLLFPPPLVVREAPLLTPEADPVVVELEPAAADPPPVVEPAPSADVPALPEDTDPALVLAVFVIWRQQPPRFNTASRNGVTARLLGKLRDTRERYLGP